MLIMTLKQRGSPLQKQEKVCKICICLFISEDCIQLPLTVKKAISVSLTEHLFMTSPFWKHALPFLSHKAQIKNHLTLQIHSHDNSLLPAQLPLCQYELPGFVTCLCRCPASLGNLQLLGVSCITTVFPICSSQMVEYDGCSNSIFSDSEY